MVIVFIMLQCLLAIVMALYDWVTIPPFVDSRTVERHHFRMNRFITACVNTTFVLIPLCLTIRTWGYFTYPQALTIFFFYLIVAIGTLCTWWMPKEFGNFDEYKAKLQEKVAEYKNKYRMLPKRGAKAVPDLLHLLLHLLVLSCLGFALYYLLA